MFFNVVLKCSTVTWFSSTANDANWHRLEVKSKCLQFCEGIFTVTWTEGHVRISSHRNLVFCLDNITCSQLTNYHYHRFGSVSLPTVSISSELCTKIQGSSGNWNFWRRICGFLLCEFYLISGEQWPVLLAVCHEISQLLQDFRNSTTLLVLMEFLVEVSGYVP